MFSNAKFSKTPEKRSFFEVTLLEDDEIIIPNSKIPCRTNQICFQPMGKNDFMVMFHSINGNAFNDISLDKIIKNIQGDQNITNLGFNRLENGFCYLKMLSESAFGIPFVFIYYYDGKRFVTYLPIRGNNINIYTEYPIVGDHRDVFWLWEQMNPGAKRDDKPIKMKKKEFGRLKISHALIDEEIRTRFSLSEPSPCVSRLFPDVSKYECFGKTFGFGSKK